MAFVPILPALHGLPSGLLLQNLGVWVTSGNFYWFWTARTDDPAIPHYIRVLKSTDSGATWNDVTVDPSIITLPVSAFNFGHHVAIALYNKIFYVWRREIVSGGTLTSTIISRFDTNTDTWMPDEPGPDVATYADHGHMVVLLDGRRLIAYGAVDDVSGLYQRASYTIWNGSAWSAPIDIAGSGGPLVSRISSIIVDSSGRVHFFLAMMPPDYSGDYYIYHRCLTGGTLGPLQQLTNTIYISDPVLTAQGAYYNGMNYLQGPALLYMNAGIEMMTLLYSSWSNVGNRAAIRCLRAPATSAPTWSPIEVVFNDDVINYPVGTNGRDLTRFPNWNGYLWMVSFWNLGTPIAFMVPVIDTSVYPPGFPGNLLTAAYLQYFSMITLTEAVPGLYSFWLMPETFSGAGYNDAGAVVYAYNSGSGWSAPKVLFYLAIPKVPMGIFTPIAAPSSIVVLGCTLTAFPTTINVGGSSTLSWTTLGNPVSAFINQGVGAVDPAGGSVVVAPIVTTTYTLTVTDAQGNTSICTATIIVVTPNQNVVGQCI